VRDYIHGAFEALNWVRNLVSEEKDIQEIQEEIKRAMDEILSGLAIDFRNRLKATI